MLMMVGSERAMLMLATPSQQLAACADRRTLNVTRKLQNAPTLMGLLSASAKVGTSNTTRWTTPAEVLFFMWCILPEFPSEFLFQWKWVCACSAVHAKPSILWINISSSSFFYLVRGLFSRHWRHSVSLGIILSLSGACCESQWLRRGRKGPGCFGLQFSGTEQRWRLSLPVLILSELSVNLGEVL